MDVFMVLRKTLLIGLVTFQETRKSNLARKKRTKTSSLRGNALHRCLSDFEVSRVRAFLFDTFKQGEKLLHQILTTFN